MERRRRPEPPPTPPPNPHSSFLRDVSNYKTPRPNFQNPNPSPLPIFFTASKNTPSSNSSFRHRPSVASISHSKAARRLKALELEQSRSSRKAEIRKEKALKSFSRSISSWLNFLFQNPKACGCKIGVWSDDRDGGAGWRGLKRQRNCSWRGAAGDGAAEGVSLSSVQSAKFSSLKVSLKDVCSFEDMRERMEGYMSKKSCDEVLLMMSQVCKNIDEGRLKMKVHCPIVTDLALKEKATRVLMCYNPMWLRIGLHIVFGGDSLLNEEGKSDQEDLLLKMIIENQFFTHMVIARSYAYNKLVEGLYRLGYFEALGNIILKRFLLLVISLDKAKCESTLPIKYGIDGIDGGSPVLFCCHSHIKSSRQAIQEFLLEAMHGEGDLLAHLVILGCKVNYQQFPLGEYEFIIRNLFEDLQDGLMLCRAIQLLKSDASILSKVIAPSDTRKKNLQNCSTAMQYLKQAGVPLSDGDGVLIVAEDVVNGDKELALSILWNMFVHLQVPLLIDKTSLVEEIIKIKGSDVDLLNYNADTEMGLLLTWIQAVCERQFIKVGSFSSMNDGKAFCCLIDYYFRFEENQDECDEALIRHFDIDTADAVHNFAFVQSVTAMLGNFPEVFQLCDILDQDASYDERSVIILLVFLGSQLIYRKKLDPLNCRVIRANSKKTDVKPLAVSQLPLSGNNVLSNNKSRGKNLLKFVSQQKKAGMDEYLKEDIIEKIRLIQGWWRALRKRNLYLKMKLAVCIIQRAVRCHLLKKSIKEFKRGTKERAASVIQSQFRGFTERKKFLKIKMAVSLLQTAIRAWLALTSKYKLNTFSPAWSLQRPSYGICDGYLRFMIERHKFLRMKKSVLLIQQAARAWVTRRHRRKNTAPSVIIKYSDSITAVTTMPSFIRDQTVRSTYVDLLAIARKQQGRCHELEAREHLCRAAIKIQLAWKSFTKCNLHLQKRSAAIKIQSYWRGWYMRKKFLCQVAAAIKIQAGIRCLINQKAFKHYRLTAIEIQRFTRGQLARKRLLGASYLRSGRLLCGSMISTSLMKNHELKIVMHSILKLQRWWKQVLLIKSRTVSAILIQSLIRGGSVRRAANNKRRSIFIIQRWWRNTLAIKSWKKSVIIIQAYVRGWIARRAAERKKQNIVVVQSYWKGYLVRKDSRQQLLDLRCRMQKSAANVVDDRRLINRLVGALSELLGCRSISNIRHTCATLNMASEHSQKCCETLVAAGAIDILLKQFHLLNRGIPDQEVLKHVISTLRNIARYPQLLQVLIDTPQAVELIFQELFRNKSEGFFVTCELLKKLCTTREGLKAICRLHGHVRRLNNLVHDLERKTELQKRNARLCTGKDITVRRLREVADLMSLISDDH